MTTRAASFPVAGLVCALSTWFVGMAGAAATWDPEAVIVFGPANAGMTAIAAADGALLASGLGFAVGRSDRSGFVRRLYARGAWFVWPALSHGCFSGSLRR